MNPTRKKGTRKDVERKFRKQHAIDGEGNDTERKRKVRREVKGMKGHGGWTIDMNQRGQSTADCHCMVPCSVCLLLFVSV